MIVFMTKHKVATSSSTARFDHARLRKEFKGNTSTIFVYICIICYILYCCLVEAP